MKPLTLSAHNICAVAVEHFAAHGYDASSLNEIAVGAGMRALIASYGFEDHGRLTDDFAVPPELISRTPAELANRLCHALDLGALSSTA